MDDLFPTILVIAGAVYYFVDMSRFIHQKRKFWTLAAIGVGCVSLGFLLIGSVWGGCVGALAANVASRFGRIRKALVSGIRKRLSSDVTDGEDPLEEYTEEDR